jgi:hypothetical protein
VTIDLFYAAGAVGLKKAARHRRAICPKLLR